jgi:murein DD-endopeptidase MepM/ murein hydrolase activator NlpD
MTVRSGRRDRGVAVVLTLAACLLLSGCATPLTHFEWGTRRASAGASVKPVPAKTAAYRQADKPHCACDEVPVPTPRPAIARTEPAWYRQSVKPAEPAGVQPAVSKASFAWPMEGRVLSDFGATPGGGRNDGINIAASEGAPIHAAADGTVSYSGNELKSYGNLALIKHDNGYVTAYAHAERFVVSKGDHVTRGQVIGYAGSTGDVTSPQLHFEIRKGAHGETPVNPRPFLGPVQVASR